MRFHSSPIDEHAEAPLADEGRLEALMARWDERERPARGAHEEGNSCYVVSVHDERDEAVSAARLAEIEGLVDAQGDRVVGRERYTLTRPDPRTLIGSGVAARVGEDARARGADLLVIDAELSPSQTRNLEDATGLPVCDREAVILNVFERHATTRRARAQVQIAHLEYLRPRIRGIGLNMDQQAGGLMGAKGPGETASELLARRLDGRLADLRRQLADLERADATQRSQRARAARVALVGYTNAGKTSLMNALTSAGLSVRDRPFETLDTTARALSRHGGDVILSDTVGFIRDLPERLFASFASTLAEATEASLLLFVLDASDPEVLMHLRTTREVLARLGAAEVPRLVVLNKVDRLADADAVDALASRLRSGAPDDEAEAMAETQPETRPETIIAVSSRDPESVSRLREAILQGAREDHVVRQIFVPYERGDLVGVAHARCRVLDSRAAPRGVQLTIEGPPRVVEEIARASRRRS